MTRGGLLKAGALTAAGLAGAGIVGAPRSVLGAPVYLKKRYKIAIMPKGLANPVFNTANWGGAWRAQQLGNVDFHFIGSVQSDPAAQVTAFDNAINAGYDGIGVSCNDAQTMVAPINHAVSKGIVVMCWDSDSANSKRATFYGVDSYAGGQKLGTMMNSLTKGKSGNVWVLSGEASAPNLVLRIKGVKSVLNKSLHIKGYSYCNDDIPTAVQEVETSVRANPDLVGYIMVGGWPLFTNGALPHLEAAAKKGLQVVSFDYLNTELHFVQDGTVKALVGQDYWGWGYQSVQIIYEILQGKHWPAFIPQASPVVTTANIGQYVRLWQVCKGPASCASVFKEAPLMPS